MRMSIATAVEKAPGAEAARTRAARHGEAALEVDEWHLAARAAESENVLCDVDTVPLCCRLLLIPHFLNSLLAALLLASAHFDFDGCLVRLPILREDSAPCLHCDKSVIEFDASRQTQGAHDSPLGLYKLPHVLVPNLRFNLVHETLLAKSVWVCGSITLESASFRIQFIVADSTRFHFLFLSCYWRRSDRTEFLCSRIECWSN